MSRPRRIVQAPNEAAYVEGESPAPGPVRAPSADVRPTHPLWLLSKVVFGLALVLGAAGTVAIGAHRYALSSPRFAIQRIELEGARRFTPDAFSELSGIRTGQNLLGVDLDAGEAKLLSNPWLEKVRLTRRLPGTLHLDVVENEPAALAMLSGELLLLTAEGRPFKRFEPKDPADLPIVSGVTQEELASDRAAATRRLAQGVDVLRQYERLRSSARYPLQEVHLEASGKVVLTLGEAGLSVHLGPGSTRQRLLMVERILERLSAQGRTPAILFADNEAHPERVVVRVR